MLKWVYKHVVSVMQRVTTGPITAHYYSSTSLSSEPLPKRALHTVLSSAALFHFPAFCLSEGHPVATYVFAVAFPSLPTIMCFRRQFLLSV